MEKEKRKKNNMPTNDQDNELDNTHVPSILYSFTLQVRQMMNELISLDLNKIVSIEALDDVAVEISDITTLEQIKSVQSTNNPVTDRSPVFWKTLFNWYNYIQDGNVSIEQTIFRFIIVSDRYINQGAIPLSFHSSDNDDDAKEALLSAKQIIYGKNDNLKETVPDSYCEYLAILFDEKNYESVIKIIKSMKIVIHQLDFEKKLYEKFCSQSIPQEYADELFTYMLGWVHQQVNHQVKLGLPAYIMCNNFRNELLSQIRRYNQDTMIAWTTVSPSENETENELKRQDTYIKQLNLIEIDASSKLQAASDYLRTSAEKTVWAEKGIVAPQSFDDYYNGLERMWQNQSHLISLEANENTDISNGQKLYFRCQENTQNAKVQGKNTPEFFGPGSLHTLANIPRIGWHNNYKQLLKVRQII